jgi:hypothetical protein
MVLALAGPGPAGFLVAVAVDAGLSLLVFRHADRHGSHHPTAWGIFTFLFAGLVIPFYFLRHALRTRRA